MVRAPIWTAKEAYEACDPPYSWDTMLEAHLSQGYCCSTPSYFICARPVDKDALPELQLNPTYRFPLQHCNAWFVYMVAGDAIPSLWTVYPHDLPWVMFYRLNSNQLRIYPTERIRRLSHGKRSKSTTKTKSGRSAN